MGPGGGGLYNFPGLKQHGQEQLQSSSVTSVRLTGIGVSLHSTSGAVAPVRPILARHRPEHRLCDTPRGAQPFLNGSFQGTIYC